MPDHATRSPRPPEPIIHIAVDDKFVDMGFREFEIVAPGMNRLIIPGEPRPLRHVHSPQAEFMPQADLRRLLQSGQGGAVIFHTLPDSLLALAAAIPRERKVLWIGWGYDYYPRLLGMAFPHGLLLPQTAKLVATRPRPPLARRVLRQFRRRLGELAAGTAGIERQALARIDYFSPVLATEFDMARELNHWFRPEHLDWNYGTLEDFAPPAGIDCNVPGNDILVGNSATPENNHLEVFELLAATDLGDRRIIVPLSYGNHWYRDRIIDAGRARFGDRFVPLTDYLPAETYAAILADCGHAFMNHLRQQALGNICTLMLRGAHISMNPASPLYRWLRERGARIGTIDGPGGDGLLGDAMPARMLPPPLDAAAREANYRVIEQHYMPATRRQKTRAVIAALGSNST